MENMNFFILLDCVILLGFDLQWMGAANVGDGGCLADGHAPEGADLGQPPSPIRGKQIPVDKIVMWSPDKFRHIDFTNDIKLPDGPVKTPWSFHFAIAIIMFRDKQKQAEHKAFCIEFHRKCEDWCGIKIDDT